MIRDPRPRAAFPEADIGPANVPTASEVREPDVYPDSSDRLVRELPSSSHTRVALSYSGGAGAGRLLAAEPIEEARRAPAGQCTE